MKWLVTALVAALFVGGLVLLPRVPLLRRFAPAMPDTCEGRFEGRWRLLPEMRVEHPDLTDGCERLAIEIDQSIPINAGYDCPSLWGSVSVDSHTRTWHSNFTDLVFNDGDSYVIDPCGQNCPLSVMVWKQEYRAARLLLSVLKPLGPADDRLEIKGYLGGQHVTLMYERDL